jgi:hypothetical protein
MNEPAERLGDRVAQAGYRRDWRGLVAYLFTPEAWTAPAFTCFVMAVGGFICAALLNAATKPAGLLAVFVNGLLAYGIFVRPVLRVAKRRAAVQSESSIRR